MATCDQCGDYENLPYNCRHCGGTFCAEHRLPENHDCPGLDGWNDPGGVFDSGFDDSVRYPEGRGRSEGIAARVGLDTGVGGPLGYFRGNMAYLLLAAMWVTFVLQWVVIAAAGAGPNSLHEFLFVLHPAHLERVWTWFTSVFAHGGFGHIAINSIVLYFFGPVLERRIGSRRFTLLFFAAGVLAGLAHTGVVAVRPLLVAAPAITVFNTPGVLGASGAIAGVMGALTVLNPNLRIYLYFILPMPLWVATALFAGYSVFASVGGGIGAGGVAQLAHLAGLGVGLAYGFRLKAEGVRAPRQLQFGRSGGPGGPGGPGGRF